MEPGHPGPVNYNTGVPRALTATGSDSADASVAVRDLCARLFQDPRRLVQIALQPVGKELLIPEHQHSNWLQFDLAIGCRGQWLVEDRPVSPRGVTAMVFYPLQKHGYRMKVRGPGGGIYSFKIRVNRHWRSLRHRVFPPVTFNVTGEQPLVRCLDRLCRMTLLNDDRSPMVIAALAEALCLWPGTLPKSPGAAAGVFLGPEDEPIRQARQLIHQRLAQPPTLVEVAAAAHLSPRHFARRFHTLHGCTPHAYLNRCRAAYARDLLAQGDLSVTQVADMMGFPSIHTFSRWFRRQTGRTPTSIRLAPSLL